MTTNNAAFITKSIRCSSRASIRLGESYFTFECTEERAINYDALPKDLNEREECINNEYSALWDTVNAQVDDMIAEVKSYTKNKK